MKQKRRRKISAREVAVLLRVRNQLLRMQRMTVEEPDPTVEEYRAMDRTISMMEIVRPQIPGYICYPDIDLGYVNLRIDWPWHQNPVVVKGWTPERGWFEEEVWRAKQS